jgi:hypothetical protein
MGFLWVVLFEKIQTFIKEKQYYYIGEGIKISL